PDALYATLLQWLPHAQAAAAAATSAAVAGLPAGADLLPQLATIDGLDLDGALVVTRGNPQRLARLLRMFASGHAGDPAALRSALAEGDRQTAERIVHGLKGIAGTLAIRRLFQLASSLNNRLREGEEIAALAAEVDLLAAELAAVCEGIGLLPAGDEQAS
ncbi:MAG: Hpt domain-containing protein, partial [Dechloromonas sp.]